MESPQPAGVKLGRAPGSSSEARAPIHLPQQKDAEAALGAGAKGETVPRFKLDAAGSMKT
eukprot:6201063-Pleurochrysis_carterae.AAC.2